MSLRNRENVARDFGKEMRNGLPTGVHLQLSLWTSQWAFWHSLQNQRKEINISWLKNFTVLYISILKLWHTKTIIISTIWINKYFMLQIESFHNCHFSYETQDKWQYINSYLDIRFIWEKKKIKPYLHKNVRSYATNHGIFFNKK